jgi:hypothetical protein
LTSASSRAEKADTKDASAYIEQQKLKRRSPEEAAKNFGSWQDAQIATGLAGELKRQKAQPRKPLIAYGGAGFPRELIKHDLVDEYPGASDCPDAVARPARPLRVATFSVGRAREVV